MKRAVARKSQALETFRSVITGACSYESGSGEPRWEQMVVPLGIPPESAQVLGLSLRQLWQLPFADKPALADLLLFRYTTLPQIRERAQASGNLQDLRQCALFELLVDMALQGNSVFPQNPTHIAQQVRQALETSVRKEPFFDVLLDLLISPDGQACRSGFNFAQVTDVKEIVQYEQGRHTGSPEWCWKAKSKYDQFAAEVKRTPEFDEDWLALSRNFKLDHYRDPQGIIRRSPMVEGNWRKASFSDLCSEDSRFQVAFDFFCWKWFLYAMQGDEPMVQKLAVTLTPFGTQIFIPGFWSLDPARDINWNKITRLHRARGIRKQGDKLIENQKARELMLNRIVMADRTARRDGLRGRARYRQIKEAAGLSQETDDAEIRRYLREARRGALKTT
jgi:hypothetical protein